MPVTYTQDEWNRRRVDVRHINPSIMEGERGHSSLFGQGSAIPIVRYAPTFLVQPSVSGSFKIPSVLTCNPGVIDASPQANLFYQWLGNGVPIVGETSKTITTILDFDAVELTCEVTAVNPLGVAVGLSNGITAERVEPIEVREQQFFSLTGMGQNLHQAVTHIRNAIVTGIRHEDLNTILNSVQSTITGIAAQDVATSFAHYLSVITGLHAEDQQTVLEKDDYTVFIPIFDQTLPVVNPDAETGDFTGWITSGTPLIRITSPVRGTYSFHGGNSTNSSIQQDIDLPIDTHARIDIGEALINLEYWTATANNSIWDYVTASIQFFDEFYVPISTESFGGQFQPRPDWNRHVSDIIHIPVGARSIQLRFSFFLPSGGGSGNDGIVDDIVVNLWKEI